MLALRLGKIALDRSVSTPAPNVFRLRLGVTALRLVLALVWLSLFALGPNETALRHSILVPAPFRIGLQPIAIALRSSVFTFARSLALLGPNMHATETMTGGVASGARDRRIGVLGPEQPAHAPATGRRSTDTTDGVGGSRWFTGPDRAIGGQERIRKTLFVGRSPR